MRSIALITLCALAGCDAMYGVARTAPLNREPDADCVERVVRSARGVTSVEARVESGGRPITMTGLKPATEVHSLKFRGPDHVVGVLTYSKDYQNVLEFGQYLKELNRGPPQEDVDATRPVMREIEVRLTAECGLEGLAEGVRESCSQVECPAL